MVNLFPKFIQLIFHVNEVQNIVQNPKDKTQKEQNNYFALVFLFNRSKNIADLKPNFENEKEKENLLSLTLINQCFKLNFKSIIEKCNKITETIGIVFQNENEFISIKCLLSILYVFTNGLIAINSTKNFDQELINNFKKASVPLVIDEKSLTEQYKYQFYIQIEIIFEFFSDSFNYLNFCNNSGDLDQNLFNYSFNVPQFDGSQKSFDELQNIHNSILKTFSAIGRNG